MTATAAAREIVATDLMRKLAKIGKTLNNTEEQATRHILIKQQRDVLRRMENLLAV